MLHDEVENERKVKTTEMRMLHMICGKKLKNKVSNNNFREMTRVDGIEEFLQEQKLQWLGHVERIDKEKK